MDKHLKIIFPKDRGITLIGSGPLIIETAKYTRSLGISTLAIYAPRHFDNKDANLLKKIGCAFYKTNDPHQDYSLLDKFNDYSKLCICFGPAWIFKESILNIFEDRIFNFNGIPLPNYLGGAHFTWQILHNNKTGGAFIQQIDENIDRGKIILGEHYNIPTDINLPVDYEKFNNKKGINLIKKFIDKITTPPNEIKYQDNIINWDQHLYFPRLYTPKNGYVNWSWTGEEIFRFCNAFDEPYPGARSFINNEIVILKNTKFHKNPYSHPFSAGLIVRINKEKQEVWIATRDGFLEVKKFNFESNKSPHNIKIGMRIITPLSKIEESFSSIKFDSKGLV